MPAKEILYKEYKKIQCKAGKIKFIRLQILHSSLPY